MSKLKLSLDSSSYEEFSEQFTNLSHLKVDDVHQLPQTLLTLGVPGVENHEPKFGTNYSSLGPSNENQHKKSRGKKRECGEGLVSKFDANNGSGITSTRNEDGLQQNPKASYVEMHKMSEKRRRDRIAKKMKLLEESIPNCNKSDRASLLDQAIQYIQALQYQVQVMSMNRIYTAPLQFNPYMPIMPRTAFGYFFGFEKSINYSNMFSSYFSPMMFTGSQFPLLPLAPVVNNPSVAALEKRA